MAVASEDDTEGLFEAGIATGAIGRAGHARAARERGDDAGGGDLANDVMAVLPEVEVAAAVDDVVVGAEEPRGAASGVGAARVAREAGEIGTMIRVADGECDVNSRAGGAIDNDAVGGAGGGIESKFTGVVGARVSVALDGRERTDRSAGVDRERGVEGAAEGAERGDAGLRRSPRPPDGSAAGVARVRRFAAFLGGADGGGGDFVGGAGERDDGGERIVGRSDGGVGHGVGAVVVRVGRGRSASLTAR